MKLTKKEKKVLQDGLAAFGLAREELRNITDPLIKCLKLMDMRKEAYDLENYLHGSPDFRATIHKIVEKIS